MLAIVDVVDERFHRDDYEACTVVTVLLEVGAAHPLGTASVEHLSNIRNIVSTRATEAGLIDVDEFSWSWHILMKGSIVSGAQRDRDSARRAKKQAQCLINHHAALALTG